MTFMFVYWSGLLVVNPASVKNGQEKIAFEVYPCCNTVGRDVVPLDYVLKQWKIWIASISQYLVV